jgi:hypothetical protein
MVDGGWSKYNHDQAISQLEVLITLIKSLDSQWLSSNTTVSSSSLGSSSASSAPAPATSTPTPTATNEGITVEICRHVFVIAGLAGLLIAL